MTDAALKIEDPVHVPAPVRRFEPADLSQHGPWLIKRLPPNFRTCRRRHSLVISADWYGITNTCSCTSRTRSRWHN